MLAWSSHKGCLSPSPCQKILPHRAGFAQPTLQHYNVAMSELELLAPAGDWAALEAALEAGAGAVYFGLTVLNARRRAKNFRQDEFVRAVELIHARGARAYLTLNIDLTERELGQAARIMELARQCRADAVLVRDPALLALRAQYPELEFHFSTQTCMANSADVAAAGSLGAARTVLAREMSLAEIAAASAVPGVQTEVFVQGALCFSVSGRCLLSSWLGGRSGNRGACTSTCRVPWQIGGRAAGTPLSMHDLAAVHRLDELRRAGVAGLKIEGRLKNAAWVRQAVALYRRALDAPPGDWPDFRAATGHHREAMVGVGPKMGLSPSGQLLAEATLLGAYTGRAMTCGYLDGQREALTAESGRCGAGVSPATDDGGPTTEGGISPTEGNTNETTYDLAIDVQPRGMVCRCQCNGHTVEWSVPKTVVRRAHKAVAIGQVFELLGVQRIEGCQLGRASTNEPEFLLVPRAVNALQDRIAAAIRQARKPPAETVKLELPSPVRAVLEKDQPHETNRLTLGDRPDRVRLPVAAVGPFVRAVRPEALIVEGVTPGSLPRVLAAAAGVPVIVALPLVFFEDDIPRIRKLLVACKAVRLAVEVNSWGAWRLAREAGLRIESGPGLPVLNSLAARMLRQLGIRGLTLSLEADRRQLEELTANCPAPCSLVVFGRPPLCITRVRMPKQHLGQEFEDRRGARVVAKMEQGLCVLRPVDPFDLRDVTNPRIRVRHLVVDLVGSPDPVRDWHDVPCDRKCLRFNFGRTLA
jgi:U32 family peptidase